jgi:hypothetical protein
LYKQFQKSFKSWNNVWYLVKSNRKNGWQAVSKKIKVEKGREESRIC